MQQFTNKQYQNLITGVRIATLSALQKPMPYACIVSEKQYNDYIRDYKAKIMPFLPFSYLGYEHTHPDIYVHFAPISVLQKIIQNGYLTNAFANEENTIGKAIYTYPLSSMMYFYQELHPYGFLIFKADAPHVHLVQSDDGVYGLGEADFFTDKLWIQDPILISSVEEMEKLSIEQFDWEKAKTHYYGLPHENIQKPETVEELMNILDWFSIHSIPTEKLVPPFLKKG